MPTHALLGATGSTGSAVLSFLLDEPPKDFELNIFVRNKDKLLKTFPQLEQSTPFPVHITEANTDDIAALKSSLEGAEVIYNCISTNESSPGISTSRDIAKSVITALEALRSEQTSTYRPPTVICNRSATLNAELRKSASPFVAFIHFALGDCYYDIDEACKMFESASKETHLIDYIFADPPSLHASPGTGRTGHELMLMGEQSGALSYADLGAALVDLAQHRDQYAGKAVGISATGRVDTDIPQLMSFVARGLRARLLRF